MTENNLPPQTEAKLEEVLGRLTASERACLFVAIAAVDDFMTLTIVAEPVRGALLELLLTAQQYETHQNTGSMVGYKAAIEILSAPRLVAPTLN